MNDIKYRIIIPLRYDKAHADNRNYMSGVLLKSFLVVATGELFFSAGAAVYLFCFMPFDQLYNFEPGYSDKTDSNAG